MVHYGGWPTSAADARSRSKSASHPLMDDCNTARFIKLNSIQRHRPTRLAIAVYILTSSWPSPHPVQRRSNRHRSLRYFPAPSRSCPNPPNNHSCCVGNPDDDDAAVHACPAYRAPGTFPGSAAPRAPHDPLTLTAWLPLICRLWSRRSVADHLTSKRVSPPATLAHNLQALCSPGAVATAPEVVAHARLLDVTILASHPADDGLIAHAHRARPCVAGVLACSQQVHSLRCT